MADWIKIEDELPPTEETVWLVDRGAARSPFFGSRGGDGRGGWLWWRDYEPYIAGAIWKASDGEATDIHPTHWMRLPEMPK